MGVTPGESIGISSRLSSQKHTFVLVGCVHTPGVRGEGPSGDSMGTWFQQKEDSGRVGLSLLLRLLDDAG